MDEPITEMSSVEKARKKVADFRTHQDEMRQIAGSGGELWSPGSEECPLPPASDHIIIRKEEAVGKVGMIHLPGQAAEKTRPNRGTVLKVGDDIRLFAVPDTYEGRSGRERKTKVTSLVPDDVVIYHEYGEVKFTYRGVDYIAIREKDVICRVENTDAQTAESGGVSEAAASDQSSQQS